MAKAQKPSFETALKELEAIVDRMESNELPLEEALKAFEEGIRLTQICQKALAEAEQKIEKVQNALDRALPKEDDDL